MENGEMNTTMNDKNFNPLELLVIFLFLTLDYLNKMIESGKNS